MANNKHINQYAYNLTSHLKKNYAVLIWVAVFCVVGIVIGLALVFGPKSYLNLLTAKNQNMLGYISGSASVFKLFWSRLFSSLFAMLIIFVFSLNYYTSFFSFFYFSYQSAVCTLVCGTLIGYQGFSAVLNTILLIVPSNLILLSLLALVFSVFFNRAKRQIKYKQGFANSFSQSNFWQLSLICVLAVIALNILISLVVPLLLKGIYLIYY